MPANKSTNKVRVTKLFGGSHPLGYMDPKVNMRVKYGQQPLWIVGLQSGNYTVDLALSSGGTAVRRAYPHDLMVDVVDASGQGWPTGGGSVKQAHGVTWPNGVSVGVGSGTSYLGGDGTVHTFGR
jgi:hypothetical protein